MELVFLHLMVQKIIISEGTDSTNENVQDKVHKKNGQLQKANIAGCGWVKHRPQPCQKSLGMDSGVLSSYVSNLEMLLDKYWSGRWFPNFFCCLAHTSTKLFKQFSIWCERGEEGEKR